MSDDGIISFPLDPFTYLGRVKRDDNGKVTSMEVFSPEDSIELHQGDEFITFTTVIEL
jgi:hypothetical protein